MSDDKERLALMEDEELYDELARPKRKPPTTEV
jgi:hypothetical protein